MADSNITVGGLVAVGGVGQITLTWDSPVDPHAFGGLPYLQQSSIEVWASASNNRAVAGKIAEIGAVNSFIHTGINRGEQKWYWIRPRNIAGNHGEWHPVSPTGGVNGIEATQAILSDNGLYTTPNGMVEQWGVISSYELLLNDPEWQYHAGDMKRLIFPTAFDNAIVHFSAIGGPNLVDSGQGVLTPAPVMFCIRELTREYASFSALSYTEVPSSAFTSLPYGVPIRWRALGY